MCVQLDVGLAGRPGLGAGAGGVQELLRDVFDIDAEQRAVFAAAAKAQQAADYVESLAKPAPSAPAEIAKAA